MAQNGGNVEQNPSQAAEGPPLTATRIRQLYSDGRRSVASSQHEYWLNHAYLLGEQWLWFNATTNQLESLQRDPERVQATFNHLMPISRSIMSRLNSRPLVFNVSPSAADDGTLRAARMAESVVTDVARTHDWELLREDVSWSIWKGGYGAISIEWDETLGQPLGLSETGEEFGTGDTVETALSSVDFVVEPGVRDAKRGRWWIKSVALPPKSVQEHFNLPEEPAADATAGLTPFQRGLFESHQTGGAYQKNGSPSSNLTLVLSYYERPNRLRPKGYICHVVGMKIVKESDWYFPWTDRLNLIVLKETRVDGAWWGTTILRSGRSVQNAINQSWSSIIEHMKLAGNARLYVPQSAYEYMREATDTPGEIVAWPDGVNPPAWTVPPGMPDWWIREPERLLEELQDILGSHDASQGQAPNNIQSGLGLSILVEQDATPIGRMSKEHALGFGDLATLLLKLYEDKVTEKRTAVIRAEGQPPETVGWIGRELQGQTDAEVPTEAILPRNRAQALDFAKQAAQMQLLNDPAALARFIKLADIPQQADVLEGLAPDNAKARRENQMMFVGDIPDPESMDIDDHNIHTTEHLTAMKSPRWDQTSPKAKRIFRQHVQAHATLSAEELGKQQAKAEISPLLASAASPTGAPALPVATTGPQAVQQAQAPPPQAAPAGGPPGGQAPPPVQ
jgi:hypothetical protein